MGRWGLAHASPNGGRFIKNPEAGGIPKSGINAGPHGTLWNSLPWFLSTARVQMVAGIQAEPQELKLWQRFHVRLSALYGTLVFGVLLSIAAFFYNRGVDAERTALQARLRIAAAALAPSIKAEDLATIRVPSDTNTPAFRRIATHFKAVSEAEPEFSDFYIMRPGSKPDSLEIVVDVVIRADAPSGKTGRPLRTGLGHADPRGVEESHGRGGTLSG